MAESTFSGCLGSPLLVYNHLMNAVTDKTWDLPVAEQPDIRNIAVGVHPQGKATYTLPELWTLHLFLAPVEVGIQECQFRMDRRHILLVPPGIPNHYFFPSRPNRYYYTHFALPSRTAGPCPAVPAVIDLASDFPRWEEDFMDAIQSFPESKLRAEIRLWDMLLRLQDATRESVSTPERIHPVLQKAIRLIELRLTEPLPIAALAAEVGISHNQLTRLFQKRFGKTAQAYARSRKLLRARHLLLNTTRSVKEIAVEVGIANLQLFNKSIRREFGCSPRALRGGRQRTPSTRRPPRDVRHRLAPPGCNRP